MIFISIQLTYKESKIMSTKFYHHNAQKQAIDRFINCLDRLTAFLGAFLASFVITYLLWQYLVR